jgi:hypothetical protein
MNFFDIICTTDNPILDTIFSYHRVNLDIEYQSPLLLVDKKMRRIYIDYIGNSIKMPIDLSKHSLNGIGNFSEKLRLLILKYPRTYKCNTCSADDIKEISKFKNISTLCLKNIRNCNDIVTNLDKKKIKYLSIDNDVPNEIMQYILDNFLNLISLKVNRFYEHCSLKSIKNLKSLIQVAISIKDIRNLKYLTKIKNLEMLWLSLSCNSNNINYLSYLGKFKNLTSIMFDNFMSYRNDLELMIVEYICQNNSLESISLDFVVIDSNSLKLLIDKNLKELSLFKCRLYDVFDCLKFLENNIEKINRPNFKIYVRSHIDILDDASMKIINYLETNLKNFIYCY